MHETTFDWSFKSSFSQGILFNQTSVLMVLIYFHNHINMPVFLLQIFKDPLHKLCQNSKTANKAL